MVEDKEEDKFEKFNVAQYFSDGTYEYVRQNVLLADAFEAVKHYTNSVGARVGTTVKVIVTDSSDLIVYEWDFEKGIIFPLFAKESSTIQ